MDARYLHSTMVHGRGTRGRALMTVIPRPALTILGVGRPGYSRWERAGRFYRVLLSRTGAPGHDILQNRDTNMAYVPREVARSIGVSDYTRLDWYVGCSDKKWEILARLGKKGVDPRQRPPRPVRPGSRVMSRLIATTRILRYGSRWPYSLTSIPKYCMNVMGARVPACIMWEGGPRGMRASISDGSNPGSRKIYTTKGGSGIDNYSVRIPGDLADSLDSRGISALEWHLASDGRGAWDVYGRGARRAG